MIGIVAPIIAASFFIGVMALPNPHSLSGHVYDNIGNAVENVEIVLTNERTNAQMHVKTNEFGEYQEDAYNFGSAYQNGDTIHYYARYKGYKIEKIATIDISKGGTKTNFVFPFSLGFVTPRQAPVATPKPFKIPGFESVLCIVVLIVVALLKRRR